MRSLPLLLVTLSLGCTSTPSSYTEEKVPTNDVETAKDDDDVQAPPKKTTSTESKPVEATPVASAPVASAPVTSTPATPDPSKEEDVCGDLVFAFSDPTGAWRYSTDSAVPDGFTAQGAVFRTVSQAATTTVPLYELKNGMNGDYLVSTVPTEGATIGYGEFLVLGNVAVSQVKGTVPLVRYLQEVPALRHRVAIDGQSNGWQPEPPRGFVCPL